MSEKQPQDEVVLLIDKQRHVVLGKPKQFVVVGNDPVQTHDELGLPMHMALYADRDCRRCNGTGSYIVHRQLAPDEVERMFGPIVDKRLREASGFDSSADERHQQRRKAMLRLQASRHTARAVENCSCALKVYGRARDYVAQQSKDRKSSSS